MAGDGVLRNFISDHCSLLLINGSLSTTLCISVFCHTYVLSQMNNGMSVMQVVVEMEKILNII